MTMTTNVPSVFAPVLSVVRIFRSVKCLLCVLSVCKRPQSNANATIFRLQFISILHTTTTTSIMAANGDGMIQSGIFEDLQSKIDEDTQIKEVRTISSEAQWEPNF